MVLYSDPTSWTWWQVFCSPPCPPLSNPYFQGEHKPAGYSIAVSCRRLGVHLVILFYFSFLKTHQKDKKIVGRYWFVHSVHHSRISRVISKNKSGKVQSKPAANPRRRDSAAGGRNAPRHSVSRSLTLPTTQIMRFCSRNACNGEVCSDLPEQRQRFPLPRAAVQANRLSSNLSPWGTALKTTANEY